MRARWACWSVRLLPVALLFGGCQRADEPAPPPAIRTQAGVSPAAAVTTTATSTPEPEAPPVRIFPETTILEPGDWGVQLLIESPTAPDGGRDLTARVAWRVESEGVVAIEPGGHASPLGAGTTVVTATLDGQRLAEARITVAAAGDAGRAWDFASDIVPIFTRYGCNSGGCHGRAEGQNGFHLSFLGYDPEGDHLALTEEDVGRRINLESPEASLLVRKATGRVRHRGGRRFEAGSDAERALLGWIGAGAPLHSGAPHGPVVELRVEPAAVWLDEPGPQQLRVVARYADGLRRDVTRLADFRTLDESAAVVDPNGLARLLRRAETDLVVRFGSKIVPVRIATPINPELDLDFASLPRRNLVDAALFARLERLKVPPSPPTDDASFLRRASLDLCGSLPRPDEIRTFLADSDPEKRAKKIDELMARKEFLHVWALKLGDLLQITSARFPSGAGYYQMWLRERLAANAPWDEMVRELLTATGNPNVRGGGPANYALDGDDPETRAERTAQRFLGLRLRCARCHDHPFDVWTQDDYYGLAAFFARVRYGGPDLPDGMMMMAAAPEVRNDPAGQVLHLRTGAPVGPRFLDGTEVDLSSDADPRAALADWMTATDNPLLSRALANWAWAQFFGRGLAEPADDLGAANPPVHPELLDALARHVVESGYDLRSLIRTIATSEAYGLSSLPVPGNEADTRLFSHHLPRPLSAHQMADALAHATGVENRYPNRSPGTRAIEIFDPATPSTILDTFGRCDRTSAPCSPVAAPALGLRQALLLIGGDVIDGKVASLNGYLANLLEFGAGPSDLVESLYLRTLCRPPTPEELSTWTAELQSAPSLREAAEDLFWALLNAREFAFNH